MQIKLNYGQEKIDVEVDSEGEVLIPKQAKCADADDLIKKGLSECLGRPDFNQFISKCQELLVIVNDATRPTPSAKIIKHLYPALSSLANIKFLIATGAHRPPTQGEYKYIFGDKYQFLKDKIYVHDARKPEEMVYLGRSKNNTEIYINKMVVEAKNVLVIGSVEPHYFAGFTGGRKSFLPGVSGYETIEMNHCLALSEKAVSLALKDNPVHEDMIDAMNALQYLNVFSIQAVLTGDHKLYAFTAGDLQKSFAAAVDYAKDIFCVPIKEKANIVISVAPYPMDVDLYQSQKALDNAKHALEEGGIIILVSKCRMGVGDETFLELMDKGNTPEEILNIIKKGYKLGYHKAAKIAEVGAWAKLWAVTDLPDKTIKRAKLRPFPSVQTAYDQAVQEIESRGKKPKTVIMPFGSLTIPTQS